jgi:hypothetical protein
MHEPQGTMSLDEYTALFPKIDVNDAHEAVSKLALHDKGAKPSVPNRRFAFFVETAPKFVELPFVEYSESMALRAITPLPIAIAWPTSTRRGDEKSASFIVQSSL